MNRLTLFLARLAGCLCGIGLALAWSAAAPPPWPGYVVRSDTVAADGSHAVVYAPVPATQPDGPPVTPDRPAAHPRKSAAHADWRKPVAGGTTADLLIVASRPTQETYGIGVWARMRGATLRNLELAGWSDGLCVEHTADVLKGRVADLVVEDCLFRDNRPVDVKSAKFLFRGQGAYVAAADRVTFRRCWFIDNGRHRDKFVDGAVVANGFSHGTYDQGGLTQWKMAEGCTKVRFEDCGFVGNAAWGACNRSDGGSFVGCFFADNAYGLLVSGPVPCEVRGCVVVAGADRPHACEWYGGQTAGAGGIQWRAAGGTLSDNLCVLPPAGRMPVRDWRAPAYELTAGKRASKTDPTYQGTIAATGGNNHAYGWDADVTNWGVAVPGLKAGPCPNADWAGLVRRAEAQARAGTADARELVATARRMAGLN